jgi:hypothetical protein
MTVAGIPPAFSGCEFPRSFARRNADPLTGGGLQLRWRFGAG